MEIVLWPRTSAPTQSCRIWLEAFEANNGVHTATSLHILAPADAGSASATFAIGTLAIPAFLVQPMPDSQDWHRLEIPPTPPDGNEATRQATLIGNLHTALSAIACQSSDGTPLEFLGVRTIAKASIEVSVHADLDRLLDADATGVVLKVQAVAKLASFASCLGVAGTATAEARFLLSFDASLQGTLLPGIGVPQLPHLSFSWPERLCKATDALLSLPKSFSDEAGNFALDTLDQLFASPVLSSFASVEVVTTPVLQAKLDDGDFSIVTGTKGQVAVNLHGGDALVIVKDFTFTLKEGAAEFGGTVTASTQTATLAHITLPEAITGPYAVTLDNIQLRATAQYPPGPLSIKTQIIVGRFEIRARSDPSLVLALTLELEVSAGDGAPDVRLKRFDLIDPYPLRLLAAAANVAESAGRTLWAFVSQVTLPTASVPAAPLEAILRRISDLLVAGAQWLQQQGSAAGRALGGLAESALSLLGRLMIDLLDAIKSAGRSLYESIAIELRIDLARRRLVRLVVTPYRLNAAPPSSTLEVDFAGMHLSVPTAMTPALLCDFEQDWTGLVLVAAAGTKLSLSTDLWLDNPKAANERVTGDPAGATAPQRVITITAGAKAGGAPALALVALQRGRTQFFVPLATQARTTDLKTADDMTVVLHAQHPTLAADIRLDPATPPPLDFTVNVEKDRILSLFRLPAKNTGAPSPWAQSIKVTDTSVRFGAWPLVKATANVEVRIPMLSEGNGRDALKTEVELHIDLRKLSATLHAGRIGIAMTRAERQLTLVGLTATIKPLKDLAGATYTPFYLDLSSVNPSLGLDDQQATLQLSYDKLSSGGQPLYFDIQKFLVTSAGLDLEANVRDDPVTLAGVDMPFRFDKKSQLVVKRNRVEAFTLSGHGSLPPALVGEAKASILLSFAASDGSLELQSCEAVLDKGSDPLRCDSTQFTLTIERLGLKYIKQDGYHFYFTLTGSAQFHPSGTAFADGLLKHLSKLKIILNETPLAGDPRVLLRHIEFLVPVDPPARAHFFDVFSYQLRGVGFHPASPAFGGAPALCLSGQVDFTDSFDVVMPRFDFHKLWIAPPAKGEVLPRIRFDGLGVGLSLGPNIHIQGMARAVDGTLPTIEGTNLPPAPVTGKGFLAEGSLHIKGFASVAASMGFLQLQKDGSDERRLAFFLYAELGDISIPIETPIGNLYIRSLGYGFGYRYTLAGIAAADQAETPRQLVALLDSISKYQGNLHRVNAWTPTYDRDSATLAVRTMVSIASSSAEVQTSYDVDEDEIPNLVLFDIVAALRTDLTFLMNTRLWIAYNYGDWRKAEMAGGQSWQQNPTLTGYMYLSAPNREFLARAVYNPGAEIGDHPKLYEPLKKAMQAVHWSSTLYIRPGLFHQELGWPYELGFDVGQPDDRFFLKVRGGTVIRFEDGALLYGLAFLANGKLQFSADTGGSFGASISALAEFALGARLVALIATNRNEAMLYGTVSLDISISFAVKMWLRTRFFSLGASFSVSLTIHVGAELLVASFGVAAQVEASVSVGAFGRSITLGIGFMVGDNKALAEARARTARYLSLGLGCDYPDPAAGMPMAKPTQAADGTAAALRDERPGSTPLPQASRKDNAKAANDRVDTAGNLSQAANPTAQPAPTQATEDADAQAAAREPGVGFGDNDFWIVLYPVRSADPQKRYLAQFIPRGSDWSTHVEGCFYAAPWRVGGPVQDAANDDAEYIVGFDQQPFPGVPLGPNATGGPGSRRTSWDRRVGRASTDDHGCAPPRLDELFDGALFMAPMGPTLRYTNAPQLFLKDPVALPEDDKARNDTLEEAARSRSRLGPRLRRFLTIEEARSSFIAMVGQSAARYAQSMHVDDQGVIHEPDVAKLGLDLDPTALGLTFLLTEADVDTLVASPDRTVSVSTRLPYRITPTSEARCNGTATLLNPPQTMFRNSPPQLAGRTWTLRPSGVQLYWDLEPLWSGRPALTGVDDPRYHLQCYRIERKVISGGSSVHPPRSFSVAQSSPLSFEVKVVDGEAYLAATPHRHRLQLVDDLSDLPEDLRYQILPRPEGPSSSEREPVQLQYLILSVDSANTFHLPIPWTLEITPPAAVEPGLTSAVLRFRYRQLPDLGPFTLPGKEFLSIQVIEPSMRPASVDRPPLLRQPVCDFELRIRPERTLSGGLFGADALAQAKAAPPVPEADEPLRSKECCITLHHVKPLGPSGLPVKVARVPQAIPGCAAPTVAEVVDHWIHPDDIGPLRAALGLDRNGGGVAARVYVRQRRVPTGDQAPSTPPPWVAAQLQLQVLDPSAPSDAAPPVDVTVERFEHPRAVRFGALERPRVSGSGRVRLYRPTRTAKARDAKALEASGHPFPVEAHPDPDGRTAVRVAWDANPPQLRSLASGATAAVDLLPLVAGFDVFAIDVASVPVGTPVGLNDPAGGPSSYPPLADYAERVCRVQRLPAQALGQNPSETGNLAQVDARYPSEAAAEGASGLWFSAAESFLQWPERIQRLSLCTRPEDTEIEALFTHGAPTELIFPALADEKEDEHQQRLRVAIDTDLLPSLGGSKTIYEKASAEYRFHLDGDGAFTVDGVRRLLLALNLAKEVSPSKSGRFSLAGRRRVGEQVVETGSATFPRPALGKRHAVLADLMDLLEYDFSAGSAYRRFEVLAETPPPVNATNLAAFLGETAADRDPSGWGALRALGLACSFRLYDVDAASFLPGSAALDHGAAMLKQVLPRYRGQADKLGAPFVDLMATPEVLSQIVGFDGGAGPDNSASVLDGCLGLIQVELRPMATRLTTADPAATKAEAIRLGRLYVVDVPNSLPRPVLLKQTDVAQDVLLEIEPCVAGATGRARTISMRGAKDKAATCRGMRDNRCLAFEEDPGEPLVEEVTLTSREGATKQFLGWVRIVSDQGGLDAADLLRSPLGDGPRVIFEEDVMPELRSGEASAWGRFSALPAAWVAGLLMNKPSTFNCRGNVLQALLGHLPRFEAPIELQAKLDLAARLGPWSQRFLDKGVAEHSPVMSTQLDAHPAGLALAMLIRPDPWRVAPDRDGKLSVLLLEKNRFGKVRKYAVRPFSRYENLEIALASSPDENASDPRRRARWLELTQPSLRLAGMFADHRDFLIRHFADAVVERTEPLSAPVILAMRTQVCKSETKANRTDQHSRVDIVVSRHPQELLSASNITVDAGIGMRHVGIGFWRRFRDGDWLSTVRQSDGAPTFDVGEAFGPFLLQAANTPALPAPLKLAEDADVIRMVRHDYERHPDLFMGAHVLRLPDLPYGFRLYATAHVAAGTVVSPQSAASADAADILLSLPWVRTDHGEKAPDKKPWQDVTLAEPRLEIQDPDPVANTMTFTLSWPLVRYVDGMEPSARALWFGSTDAPILYRAPDAGVGYRVTLKVPASGERDPQAEFRANDQATAPSRLYTVNKLGNRFTVDAPGLVWEQENAVAKCNFHFTGDAIAPMGASFANLPDDASFNALAIEIGAQDAVAWEVWRLLGPTGRRVINVKAPAVMDPVSLAAFRADVRTVLDGLVPYAGGPADTTVQAITAQLQPLLADPTPKNQSFEVAWRSGLVLPQPFAVTADAPFGWQWPAHGQGANEEVVKAMGSAGRDVVAKLHGQAGDEALSARSAILAAMLRWTVGRIDALDATPLAGIAARSFESAATVPATFESIPQVALSHWVEIPELDNRTADNLKAAIAHLEGFAGNAQAITTLANQTAAPSAGMRLPLRWRAGADAIGELAQALGHVAALSTTGTRCTLRAPIGRAAHTMLQTLDPALADRLLDAGLDMLFGTGRRPVLEVLAGTTDVVVSEVKEIA